MNEQIRAEMASLWALDDFRSKQLSDYGHEAFQKAMMSTITTGSVETLEVAVNSFPIGYYRPNKAGTIPRDAGRRLALTDYLTVYNVGLARFLSSGGETHGVIVRCAAAYEPRGECLDYEDLGVGLDAVVDGFRKRYHGVSPDPRAFSLPVGPNCHHGLRPLTDAEKKADPVQVVLRGISFQRYR